MKAEIKTAIICSIIIGIGIITISIFYSDIELQSSTTNNIKIDDKFSPYAIPLEEKVTEITDAGTYSMLKQRGVVEAIPVNFVRGLTFNKALVIVDEAQNLSRKELTTILTRFGRYSKYVVIGDCNQADVNKSGYKEIFNMFNTHQSTENDIFSFKFGTAEISRSKILKYICSVLGT